MAETETVTVTLSTPEDSSELDVSRELVAYLGEDDETVPEVVGDIAMLGLAQQVHGAVHHGHGEAPPALEAAEERTMALFEERFGRSFSEMTGHDH